MAALTINSLQHHHSFVAEEVLNKDTHGKKMSPAPSQPQTLPGMGDSESVALVSDLSQLTVKQRGTEKRNLTQPFWEG